MKIYKDVIQGSDEWHALRHGRITMSHAKELLTGGKGKTRESYLMTVAAERLSTYHQDSFYNDDMLRGNELESYALECYRKAYPKAKIETVGFVLHDDERIGCSPDALTELGGIEIKCPRPETHIKYLNRAYVESAHGPQMQGGLLICKKELWHFVSFCPWVKSNPVIIHTFCRDEETIARLEESAISGADYIDKMVMELEKERPIKSVSDIAELAIEHWDSITAMKDEVML